MKNFARSETAKVKGERIIVPIRRNACSNIGAPMYEPSSDVWLAFRLMTTPNIGAPMYESSYLRCMASILTYGYTIH